MRRAEQGLAASVDGRGVAHEVHRVGDARAQGGPRAVHRSAGTAVAEGIRRGAERRQARLHLEAEGERLVRSSQRVPSVTQLAPAAL